MPEFLQRQLFLAGNTLLVSSLVTALAGVCGVALELMLFRANPRGRRLYLALLAGMLMIPMHASVSGWYA